jgi:hypothetical protein
MPRRNPREWQAPDRLFPELQTFGGYPMSTLVELPEMLDVPDLKTEPKLLLTPVEEDSCFPLRRDAADIVAEELPPLVQIVDGIVTGPESAHSLEQEFDPVLADWTFCIMGPLTLALPIRCD